MKILRHTAADMRQALRAVREQLGPDAVILSSRRTPGGVEVSAAVDFDVERDRFAAAAEAQALLDELPPAPTFSAPELAAAAVALGDGNHAGSDSGGDNGSNAELGQELKTLRRMLETQLAQLAWNDLTRRAPIHTEVLRELSEIGLAPDLAAQIVAALPPRLDLAQSRRLAIASLSQRVQVTGDRWLENGGKVALVGPTGVGKTTTLAKLAVRWVLRHDARDLALIAGDSVRIGAQDQVQALGQLLGAQVYQLADFAELPALLANLNSRRFVLVDTPGSSQRDSELPARLAGIAAAGAELETALVLSASTQAGAIEQTIKRFAGVRPASCLLTKVDEAASLGGVLSILSREGLPISYVSEGQRVPEDLHPARSLELVSSAVQLARANGAAADEDLLRRRFGELAHALA